MLSLLLALGVSGRAEAQAAKPSRSFAVVIGNNRSLLSRRPDLHYADDDAARYFDILRTIAPERTFLLSDFDRDTRGLFPEASRQALPPTRNELTRVGREIARRVREASQAGQESDVYFIFAGHGDVESGTGFIELADSRFSSNDLEAWLRSIPFSRAHVILDSCNSFFMLGARKPGGRYFATPDDVSRSLSQRLPNVGVFLSTSAEGEAFEWSEIQSGIFSHVVRSGLLGAADANADGQVSYQELAAFVATATADVKNPNMRPHVFARGPGALDAAPIVMLPNRTGIRRLHLSDATPLRVRLRDREGLPFLDANVEAGTTLSLALPSDWASGDVLERRSNASSRLADELKTFALPTEGEELALNSLEAGVPPGSARGPAEIFQKLFARPFGPRAVAAYIKEAGSAPRPVFGVSRDDALRMNLVLGEIEGAERSQRLLSGSVMLGAGAVLVLAGGSMLAFRDRLSDTTRSDATVAGSVYLGLGGLALFQGGYWLGRPWAGERAASEYRGVLKSEGDYGRAFAVADERLRELRADEARDRWIRGILGGVLVLGAGVGFVANEWSASTPDDRLAGRVGLGTVAVLGGTLLGSAFLIQTPTQRLTQIWRRDPSLIQLQPLVAATQGGAFFGALGYF